MRLDVSRPWDLRTYTGNELGLLTGRSQSYSYRHVERFLRILATANADEAFTAALARWTGALWQVKARSQGATAPHVYMDGLSLAVYTDALIPRGLIGNSGKILGCRALTLLHDDQGHPLRASTHRGDLHLTDLVVDREAMAADAPCADERAGACHDHSSQDEPISRTRFLHQRRLVRAPHGGSAWHSATRGRSRPVSVGSSRPRR
jgi:hypothetical protein